MTSHMVRNRSKEKETCELRDGARSVRETDRPPVENRISMED